MISSMEEYKKAPPKYKIGDLVEVNNLGMIFVQYEGATRITYGLIQCEAYHYSTNTKDLILFGWWTYDILVDGQLIRMMPESFLKEVKLDESKDKEKTPK